LDLRRWPRKAFESGADHPHEADTHNSDADVFRIFFRSGHLWLSINHMVSDAFPEFPRFSGILCAGWRPKINRDSPPTAA
jgi:hypothetical protein